MSGGVTELGFCYDARDGEFLWAVHHEHQGLAWPTLEDFLLFYGFFVIPWPFRVRRGLK